MSGKASSGNATSGQSCSHNCDEYPKLVTGYQYHMCRVVKVRSATFIWERMIITSPSLSITVPSAAVINLAKNESVILDSKE